MFCGVVNLVTVRVSESDAVKLRPILVEYSRSPARMDTIQVFNIQASASTTSGCLLDKFDFPPLAWLGNSEE